MTNRGLRIGEDDGDRGTDPSYDRGVGVGAKSRTLAKSGAVSSYVDV
uniref:Uncharacterized protein n=1 Tax=Streptomyces sp. NBC_00049 TaxID=2903617 RepID=A0AAU2K4Q0_9ACTN